MRRLAVSMTLDPDGAMHDWIDAPPGWSLIKIPTQEAVHLIGVPAYQELIADLCVRDRPDVLLTHPPYDYLTEAVAARIRGSGTQLVAYAFDDEIFARHYGPATVKSLARIYDRYVTPNEVRWATAPLPPLPERDVDVDVALVGRAYARRVQLVDVLRAQGLKVATRGVGWPEGFASRGEMLALYARAAVVLTTADWEDQDIAMVKHRLLDTAMMGAFQVAQESPDLRRYFAPDEVPSYRDASELAGLVRAAVAYPDGRRRMAAAARTRALNEHTWTRRFAELITDVALGPEREPPRRERRLLDFALIALASRAETDRRYRAAAALYRERLARDPDDATAAGGFGRCLRDLGDREGALPWLRRAASAPAPPCAAALHVTIPSYGVGTGLGRLGLFPPAAEPLTYLLATLVELGKVQEAAAAFAGIEDPVIARAVAATLVLDEKRQAGELRELLARARA